MDQNKTDFSQINNINTTNAAIDNNKKKWKCSQCTYENWPSSTKCTICLGCKFQTQKLKQNQALSNSNNNNIINQTSSSKCLSKIKVIKLKNKKNNEKSSDKTTTKLLSSSSSSNENINETYRSSGLTKESTELTEVKTNDIYQIGQLLTNSEFLYLNNKINSSSQENIITQSIEKQKWPCNVCTYLNWPKSTKCVQCYTPKVNHIDNLVDSVSTYNDGETLKSKMNKKPCTNLHEQLQQTLVINNNNLISNKRSSCNSPCTVPKTLAIISKIGENNFSKKSVTDLCETSTTVTNDSATIIESKKWSCLGCTYQNWPKSQRCVMCNLQRKNNTIIETITNNNRIKQSEYHNKLKTYQLRMDRLFLAACQGIVDDDMTHLNRYINANGDLTRYLTLKEVKILNKPNVFTVGLTLLHLCYQFKRKEFLMQILSNSSTGSKNQSIRQKLQLSSSTMNLLNALLKQKQNKTKFSPCQSCPALASSIIERYFSANLRQRKTPNHLIHHYNIHHRHDHHISPTSSLISLNIQQSNNILLGNNNITTNLSLNSGLSINSASINTQAYFNIATSPSPSEPPSSGVGATSIYYQQSQYLCFYVNECHTFILPNEIDDFSPRIQQILYDELLDREVQHELENESRAINWNIDLCKRLDSKLYPLWNRHSGDCLLDSVLQACYGVFDTENTLRRIMAESLDQYSNWFVIKYF